MALSLVRCLRPVRSFHWSGLTLTNLQTSTARFISSSKEPSLPVKSVLKFKSRPVKKKPSRPSSDLEEWNVVGYSAAESFDLFGIQDALREQKLYSRVSSSLTLTHHPPLLTTILPRWSCPKSWTQPVFMSRKIRILKRREETSCSSRKAVLSSGMSRS